MSERGAITWHSSEQDGGPDCGLELDIGDGKSIYLGEMAGHVGWQLALIERDAMCSFADVTNPELARGALEALAAALSVDPPQEK